MTQEAIETYQKLDNKIKTKSLAIAGIANSIWRDKYHFSSGYMDDINEFKIDSGYVYITNKDFFCGDYEEFTSEFPVEWLTKDIEEVKSIILKEYNDHIEKLNESKKRDLERIENAEYKRYLELKNKFEK